MRNISFYFLTKLTYQYKTKTGETIEGALEETYPLKYLENKGAKFFAPKEETPDVLNTEKGFYKEKIVSKPNSIKELGKENTSNQPGKSESNDK